MSNNFLNEKTTRRQNPNTGDMNDIYDDDIKWFNSGPVDWEKIINSAITMRAKRQRSQSRALAETRIDENWKRYCRQIKGAFDKW